MYTFSYGILVHTLWINELAFLRGQEIGYEKTREEHDMTKP